MKEIELLYSAEEINTAISLAHEPLVNKDALVKIAEDGGIPTFAGKPLAFMHEESPGMQFVQRGYTKQIPIAMLHEELVKMRGIMYCGDIVIQTEDGYAGDIVLEDIWCSGRIYILGSEKNNTGTHAVNSIVLRGCTANTIVIRGFTINAVNGAGFEAHNTIGNIIFDRCAVLQGSKNDESNIGVTGTYSDIYIMTCVFNSQNKAVYAQTGADIRLGDSKSTGTGNYQAFYAGEGGRILVSPNSVNATFKSWAETGGEIGDASASGVVNPSVFAWAYINANGTAAVAHNMTVTKTATGTYAIKFVNVAPRAQYSIFTSPNAGSTLENIKESGFTVIRKNESGVLTDTQFSVHTLVKW